MTDNTCRTSPWLWLNCHTQGRLITPCIESESCVSIHFRPHFTLLRARQLYPSAPTPTSFRPSSVFSNYTLQKAWIPLISLSFSSGKFSAQMDYKYHLYMSHNGTAGTATERSLYGFHTQASESVKSLSIQGHRDEGTRERPKKTATFYNGFYVSDRDNDAIKLSTDAKRRSMSFVCSLSMESMAEKQSRSGTQ